MVMPMCPGDTMTVPEGEIVGVNKLQTLNLGEFTAEE